jgi:uncharacterized phage-associated protein
MSAHDPRVVGNRFIDVCKARHYRLTILPFMKFLYFAQGWHMAFHGVENPLIATKFEAWRLGPVSRDAYEAFRYNGIYLRKPVEIPEGINTELKPRELATIDFVVDRYKHYRPYQLVKITHAKGTPWHKLRDEHHADIPDTDIAAHFTRLMEAEQVETPHE